MGLAIGFTILLVVIFSGHVHGFEYIPMIGFCLLLLHAIITDVLIYIGWNYCSENSKLGSWARMMSKE